MWRPTQRVAIGRRARYGLGGKRAIGSQSVLHHEAVAECFAKPLGCHARNAIGVSTRGVGRNQTNRPLRPILSVRY